VAIQSFGDRKTERFFFKGKVARRLGWAGVAAIARRKLDMLHYADRLLDLRSPPGNRLEKLAGSLRGFHSIRINEQWRICFVWRSGDAHDVEIVDYH
jgi:proteic killer suppression protein